ncbi:hypothetical protein KQ910_25800 [Reyranella sp. MMS21-HV4-11]|uniref:Uncharacterized protein n=1 Tax=Reyranella humidisoli TaxID=2849149 RepID=A0ABS6IRI3_9HYPH|nr:hypothetical protein [Reyranella sp. MMS21-HV4-11]MBU8877209.1 hypothetical protein [Reyranella sp. MMS21-HV4-11]
MALKKIGNVGRKAILALVCLLARGFVSLLATWYIYSAAILLYRCSRHWNDLCFAFPFLVFLLFPRITDEDGYDPSLAEGFDARLLEAGYDPRLFAILSLALIVTVLWTVLALVRRRRSS